MVKYFLVFKDDNKCIIFHEISDLINYLWDNDLDFSIVDVYEAFKR